MTDCHDIMTYVLYITINDRLT